ARRGPTGLGYRLHGIPRELAAMSGILPGTRPGYDCQVGYLLRNPLRTRNRRNRNSRFWSFFVRDRGRMPHKLEVGGATIDDSNNRGTPSESALPVTPIRFGYLAASQSIQLG